MNYFIGEKEKIKLDLVINKPPEKDFLKSGFMDCWQESSILSLPFDQNFIRSWCSRTKVVLMTNGVAYMILPNYCYTNNKWKPVFETEKKSSFQMNFAHVFRF